MVWASVFIVLLVGCVFFYNQLAKLDALADEAWKEALNRFERRYGLLASLADTAAGKTPKTNWETPFGSFLPKRKTKKMHRRIRSFCC